MSKSTKDIFSNQNVSISNSIILNNYSIQNLILSTNNLNSYKKIPLNSYKILKESSSQISYSPSPKKAGINNILSIKMQPTDIRTDKIPLSSYKSMRRLNFYNIRKFPKDKQNIDIIPKIIPISKKSKSKEKHPQDSLKKRITKRNIRKSKIKKLNNSVSTNNVFKIRKRNLDRYDENSEIIMPSNSFSKKNEPLNSRIIYVEPKENLILKEFQFGEQIGKGTFGKIFSVKWSRNDKYYAMKREILTDKEDVQKRKSTSKIIQNLVKYKDNNGIIKIYGNLCLKKKNKDNNKISEFIYYELMEKAERDWDNEINIRSQFNLYYSENEIINIMTQLIETLSLLEKNHITHRDIKPQNILVFNGKYKLCDFGEIRVLKRDGLIVQRVRGSELYMSPILFHGLHLNLLQVRHNTYKSDVFSLGMCLFYASSLTYSGVDTIRELTDMEKIRTILFQYLSKRYSNKLIIFILSMLEINESKRLNFIQLEKKLKKDLI